MRLCRKPEKMFEMVKNSNDEKKFQTFHERKIPKQFELDQTAMFSLNFPLYLQMRPLTELQRALDMKYNEHDNNN